MRVRELTTYVLTIHNTSYVNYISNTEAQNILCSNTTKYEHIVTMLYGQIQIFFLLIFVIHMK